NLLSNNHQVNTCSEPWILLNYVSIISPNLANAPFNMEMANSAFNEYLKKYSDLNFEEKQKKFLLNFYKPLKNGFIYVLDKTPRYYEILGDIGKFFPKSKIIILKRNPIDVAKSIMTTWHIDSPDKLKAYHRDLLNAPFLINTFLQ